MLRPISPTSSSKSEGVSTEVETRARVEPEREVADRKGKYDVCEVFSPERVCGMARRMGMKAGWSIDISKPDPITKREYDLSVPRDVEEVTSMLKRDKPPTFDPVPTMYQIFDHAEPQPCMEVNGCGSTRETRQRNERGCTTTACEHGSGVDPA